MNGRFAGFALLVTFWSLISWAQSLESKSLGPDDGKFDIPLFQLVNKQKPASQSGLHYMPEVARAYGALFANRAGEVSHDRLQWLKDRLLTGPAGQPKEYALAGARYFHYPACQAERCNMEHLDVLYQATSNRMIGLLMDEGQVVYLGDPNKEERVLLLQISKQQ